MADVIDTLREQGSRNPRGRCRGCGEPHTVGVTFQIKHPTDENGKMKSVSLSASLCDKCAVNAWEANAKLLDR